MAAQLPADGQYYVFLPPQLRGLRRRKPANIAPSMAAPTAAPTMAARLKPNQPRIRHQ
jgi:hypothetical protein